MTPQPAEMLAQFVGQDIVLDVVSSYVYVGTLIEYDIHYLIMTNADVHDLRDTNTTRELYVLEARRHGVSVNRLRVLVRLDQVVSISALADVRE